jgi:hypothetical protein
MFVDEDKCVELGIDPKRVRSITRRISKAAMDAHSIGLTVFGGSGTGSLRISGRGISGTVADLDGVFDGGDGGDDY